MLRNFLRYRSSGHFQHVVVSLTSRGEVGDEIEEMGVKVHALGARRGAAPLPLHMWQLQVLGRRVRPAIIQGWMYHGNLSASWAAGWLGFRPHVVWAIRCSLPSLDRHRPLTKATIRFGARLSRFPRRVIYNSSRGLSDHVAAGYCASNGMVIPNGFDLDAFRPDPVAGVVLRRDLGIPSRVPLVCMVANYTPMKDHRTFLEAARIFHGERPDVHFILAGTGVDSANTALTEMVETRGLADRVHLIGSGRYSSGDGGFRYRHAFVVEAFPNVVGEAMACGVPVVASDVGDVRGIVGDTGIVVLPKCVQGFVNAWRRIFDMPAEAREQFGLAARAGSPATTRSRRSPLNTKSCTKV